MFNLLRHQYPTVAHILALTEFAFGPKPGFKNKCRAGLGLQYEARLKLCCTTEGKNEYRPKV